MQKIKAQEKAKFDEMARLEALTTDQTVGIVKRNMSVQQLAQLKGEDSLPMQKAKLTQEAVVRRLKKATDAAAVETQKAKEAEVASAKAAVVAAEATQNAVVARKLAEAKRAEAVAAREAAEAKRALAVAARELAEVKRAEAVAARQAAEQKRAEAVAAREAAEQKRAEAVAAREAAEAAKAATQVAVKDCEQQLQEATEQLEVLKRSSGAPQGAIWWNARILEDKKRSLPTRMW